MVGGQGARGGGGGVDPLHHREGGRGAAQGVGEQIQRRGQRLRRRGRVGEHLDQARGGAERQALRGQRAGLGEGAARRLRGRRREEGEDQAQRDHSRPPTPTMSSAPSPTV